MDGSEYYSIGELARRTGLTVKVIRFYSDCGVVPPDGRSPAGYRRYRVDAVARLGLVRTLRELGVDLPTIRRVLDSELSLSDVAAAHADALAVRIRTLRLRHAVLSVVARRGATPREMELMHELATLSAEERARLIGEFLGHVFGEVHSDPAFRGIMGSLVPDLPDNPDIEQIEAWVELAELSRDPGFRDSMRRIAEHHAAERAHGGPAVRRDTVGVVCAHVGPAVAAGVEPEAEQADSVVSAMVAHYRELFGCADAEARLLGWLETVRGSRREEYLGLLSVVNGWPGPESLAPVLDWSVQALRARIAA